MALPLRDDQRTRVTPWITLALIAVNVAVFLFVQPAGFQGDRSPEGSQQQFWTAQERDDVVGRSSSSTPPRASLRATRTPHS